MIQVIMNKQRKRKKRNSEDIRDHWQWGGNDLNSKDILNNKTSNESDKMFATMQGLGMLIRILLNKRVWNVWKHY